jgi:hypothetical protein
MGDPYRRDALVPLRGATNETRNTGRGSFSTEGFEQSAYIAELDPERPQAIVQVLEHKITASDAVPRLASAGSGTTSASCGTVDPIFRLFRTMRRSRTKASD